MTLGYLIHHTLIAVFFWMSAMSIHVTRTMLNSFNENKSKNPNRTLLVNIVYAQGSPFLITIVTLIMDTRVRKLISKILIFFDNKIRDSISILYYRGILKPAHCPKLENITAGWDMNTTLMNHSRQLLSFYIFISSSFSSS